MIVVLAEVFWQTRYPKCAIVIRIATALLGVVTSTLTPTPIVINFYYSCHYYYYYYYDTYTTIPIIIWIRPIMMMITILIIIMMISENLLLATSRLQTGSLPVDSSTASTTAAGTAGSERSLEDREDYLKAKVCPWSVGLSESIVSYCDGLWSWDMIHNNSQMADPLKVDRQVS